MDRAEKIKIFEDFCDERELCSDGCPIWDNGHSLCSCNWESMSECALDNYIDMISATNAKEQVVNPPDAKPEMVNHPSHYCQGGIECIDAIKAATVNKRGIEAVCVANVIKYLFRYDTKNGLEDVYKSRWYLNRLIDELEAKGE